MTLAFKYIFIDIKILIIIKQMRECLHVITWMNLEDIMVSEISQSQKRQIICESTYMRFHLLKFIETEWWLSGAGEEGNWFDGYSIPILQDGKNSEDWLHYVNALNTTELTGKND